MEATAVQTDRKEKKRLNGWDLDEFQAVVDLVKEQPEAGKLTFRTRFDWDEGFAGDARTEEIEQLGQVMRRKFTLRGDHPPEHLGQNTGPTAVELLLAALGSCMTVTYAAHATARGVRVEEIEVDLEGAIDLNGFLQLAPSRPGFPQIRARVRVKSDAERHVLRELLETMTKTSPVFDSVSNPVLIEPTVERVS